MGYTYRFPTDKAQREDVVANILVQGKSLRNPLAVKWYVNNFYMQGVRDFSSVDFLNGTVTVGYLDEVGILKFRYEEIVSMYQSQMGRLMGLNLSPVVRKKGVSLDGMRKSSIGQVVLDAAITQDKVNKLKMDMLPPLMLYGTIGLGLWVEDADSMGIEVIPPWELYLFLWMCLALLTFVE